MKHHPSNKSHQHRQRRGWKFDFFGETPKAPAEEMPVGDGSAIPLAVAPVGQPLWIAGFQDKDGVNRLLSLGLAMGAEVQIVSSQPSGSAILAVGESRLGLDAGIARKILVSDRQISPQHQHRHRHQHQQEENMGARTTMQLRDMTPGTEGRIIGYDKTLSGYKGKLLSMGLTPGTEFTVIRVAPLGDPIEINLRGFHLSLRKQEANALIVEEVSNNVG